MLNSLIDGIAIKLNQEFGDEVAIYKEEVRQGLKEPCFFIMLLPSNQKQVVGKRYFREHPFDIHYFPKSKDKNTEILEVVERLYDALEYVTLDGDLIRGAKMRHEVISEVLHFFINYDLFVYKQVEQEDPMEDIVIKSELKG